MLAAHLTPFLTLTHDDQADRPLASAAFGLYVLLVAAVMVLVTRPST